MDENFKPFYDDMKRAYDVLYNNIEGLRVK